VDHALPTPAPSDETNGPATEPAADAGGARPGRGREATSGSGRGRAGGQRRSGEAASTARRRGRGLTPDRRLTLPGVHPFEAVQWERRTAAIANEKGETVFEQRDCEVPASWSQMATNVVVSKYFRGPLGSPRRETSVRQVISRVCDTIAAWGLESGHLAGPEAARVFQDELTHLVLHQMMSFNSPVWFNVGVPGTRPQASACFINSVEDTMDSILRLAHTEGMLFKYGSGTGTNLSRVRSSREALAGGGTASGPVSFMRGFDAFAGVIKSGGTTRRAAKMVILNVDHPDIREFITCKVTEERKAWALIDAGYDGAFTGEAYSSIFFQNSNNSVRVTDDFMRAVIEDREWLLRAVTDPERILGTMRARELMRLMAESAHQCGDPGIQYDTTINDWHTSASSGRINASNPCSEYMYLDDSACNLASLNLMRFLREDGTFDVAAFRHAVSITITAMEILVSNASYPTERIAENSERFRPLGLGYANLGALLMARGVPYDSPQGRELAACITAIMTGEAYAQSARVAREVGPFAGYPENRQPMLRVIGKHREAAYRIPDEHVESQLLTAARRAWDEAHELGAVHGYRNGQSTVLAPTGTISFMLDCDTTGVEPDIALVKYKKLVGGGMLKMVNGTVPMALRRLGYGEGAVQDIIAHIDAKDTIEGAPHLREEDLAVFDCAFKPAGGSRSIAWQGHVRMMSAVQPFISGAISKCITGDSLISSEAGLIRIASLHAGEDPDSFRPERLSVVSIGGDRVTDAFYYGGPRPTRSITARSGHRVTGTPNHRVLVASPEGPTWKRLDEITTGDHLAIRYGAEVWSETPARLDSLVPTPLHGCGEAVSLPTCMTSELAFLLGAHASAGHTTSSPHTVVITNAEDAVLERVRQAWLDVFGLTARIVRQPGRCPGAVVASKAVVELFRHLGCGHRAATRRIPDAVLRSPRSMVLAFLEGLNLGAYVDAEPGPKWAIRLLAAPLLDDLQAVLTNLGVVHRRISTRHPRSGAVYDEVYAEGEHAQRMLRLVPFVEHGKSARAQLAIAKETGVSPWDVVPGIDPRGLLSQLSPTARIELHHLADPRTTHVPRSALLRMRDRADIVLPAWVDDVLDDNLRFSPVVGVRDTGVQEVFDLSVPGTHAFVANGIVNHNTVNMPQEATVDDIERAYVDGWKMGLKALAIYRDGSKRSQPVGTTMDRTTGARQAATERPLRRRLPAERQALTHKFEIAGHEGYITVGLYEDGNPGEIFVKMAKEGSTVSGLMDSFATAISLALQYGVPLKVLVDKFSHARFEPSGYTGNPEIPIAKSIMDYIFRWLASRFLPWEERDALGIIRRDGTEPGDEPEVETRITAAPAAARSARAEVAVVSRTAPTAFLNQEDAPSCSDCGSLMVRSGACYKCLNCGGTSGCS
jgi:adenosylcobalamin-dependent ribonucleoside-diphosphate reductase